MQNLNAAERETTITMCDADDSVRIWTAQRTVITAIRKKKQFTETASGFVGGTEWASFSIPKDQWNPATGAKRQITMSEEAKQQSTERLRKFREEQGGEGRSS